MALPRWMLRHRVTVETYTGDGAHGPVYAEPVEVACWIDEKATGTGSEITWSADVLADPDDAAVLTPGSRVTLAADRGVAWIGAVAHHDSAGLLAIDHLAVTLT